jgi:DNA polymerase-3 subunit delta
MIRGYCAAMPAAAAKAKTKTASVFLLAGSDEFSIKEEAARLAQSLAPKEAGEFGVEIVEGDCNNQDEALRLLGRLNEAMFTVGFFNAAKLVWWKNTELLADNRTAGAEAVKSALADLAAQLKAGLPEGVRLLISAIGVDKRRVLYKALEKLGEVKLFDMPDAGKEVGQEEIAAFLDDRLKQLGKRMDEEARQTFALTVAPEFREITNELEKLDLYVGARPTITAADVRAICSLSRQAVIWELTDTLGARNVPGAIRALENLLGHGEAPLGVLAMLVNQFRLILLAKDLMTRKVLLPASPPRGGFAYFQGFQKLPTEETAHFPRSKDGKLPNGWRLYRCALAAKNFSTAELIQAMEWLTEANRQLVSTGLDERLVLEQAILKIARK